MSLRTDDPAETHEQRANQHGCHRPERPATSKRTNSTDDRAHAGGKPKSPAKQHQEARWNRPRWRRTRLNLLLELPLVSFDVLGGRRVTKSLLKRRQHDSQASDQASQAQDGQDEGHDRHHVLPAGDWRRHAGWGHPANRGGSREFSRRRVGRLRRGQHRFLAVRASHLLGGPTIVNLDRLSAQWAVKLERHSETLNRRSAWVNRLFFVRARLQIHGHHCR